MPVDPPAPTDPLALTLAPPPPPPDGGRDGGEDGDGGGRARGWSWPRLRLEPRSAPSRLWVWAAPGLAVVLTLLCGAVLFAALGKDPGASLYGFFVQPLASAYGLAELGVKAAPLTLIALGLAVGFRGGVWNIGAEGQLIFGAIAGGGVALALGGTAEAMGGMGGGGWWLLPLVLLAGLLGGMAWAAIPALLRVRFQTNEILTSLMLSYVAGLFLSWLVHGPWRNPDGYNFPESAPFEAAATLPVLWAGTRLHLGAVLALVATAGVWLVLARGFVGFQITVMGLAPRAGSYAGFCPRRLVWGTMLASGGLAGLAGVCEVAGPIGQLQGSISPGYGFTAIIVAFLGRLHPLGILVAACFLALTYLGGETVQMTQGLPLAVAGVFQGLILFFLLGADVLIHARVRLVRAGEG